MTMRHCLLVPVLFGLLTAAVSVSADTLLIERVERAKSSALPLRGATMAAVEAAYGAPETKHAAVGNPPITRWTYPAFNVYFDHNYVINAVVTKSSPEEKGPRPVPEQTQAP